MNTKNGLRLVALMPFLFLIVLTCGGCDGSNSNNQNPPTEPNKFFDGLSLTTSRGVVTVVNSSVNVTGSGTDAPTIVSFPDIIETSTGREEQLEVGYESSRGVSRLIISVENADRRFEVTLPAAETGFSGLAISLTLPENSPNNVVCLLAAAIDVNNAISDAARGCLAVDAANAGSQRIIHFATFESNSVLGTLNFDTREVVEIGATGAQLGDIAFLGDRLFGVGGSKLYELSPVTGAASPIVDLSSFGVNALESRDGLLYVASGGGDYLVVDPSTNTVVTRGVLGNGIVSSGDLAFLEDGTLLLTALTGAPSDELMRVDPQTGVAISIGETGFRSVYGLGSFRGQLLGLTFQGDFILINPLTGRGALIDQTTALRTGGASIKR